MSYQDKYIKYKNKYLELKSVLYGGSSPNEGGAQAAAAAATTGAAGAATTGAAGAASQHLLLYSGSTLPRLKTAVLGSHIMSRSGLYLGKIIMMGPTIHLNTGFYLNAGEEGYYYCAIKFPTGVDINDSRPRHNFQFREIGIPEAYYHSAHIADKGDYVVGKDGTYWGRIYRRSGDSWQMIDGNPPPGRTAKLNTMYFSRGMNYDLYKWYRLIFPPGVSLFDWRRLAEDYDNTFDTFEETYQPDYPRPNPLGYVEPEPEAQRRAAEDAARVRFDAAAQVPQFNFTQIILEKQRIITETNNAITADTTVPENIDLNSRGCDMIMTGCATGNNLAANFDVSIQSFMTDEDNINNTIVLKIVDSPTKSRIFLINRANLQTVLADSTVYPCLQANNMPGRDSNVITDLPLYSLANIVGTRLLIKRDTLDTFLQIPGNLFFVVSRHIYSYPSIASHDVVFNAGSMMSGLHCNTGSVAETLWNIKRVNL